MSQVSTEETLLAKATELALGLANWAVVRTRASKVSMTTTKSSAADYVTDIDLAVERWVRNTILNQFPDHGFVGEEFGATEDAPLVWYCDPIDGTTNFSTGLPWHSFSLALVDAEGPLVGVVSDPRTGEVFHAVRGRGAYLNGVPLHVNARTGLAGAVVLTEWLACAPWPGMMTMLEKLGQAYVTTRIMGSSTLSITGLAAGRGQGCVIGRFGAVDLLASVLICDEAGLAVRDENNQRNLFPKTGGVLVANPGVVEELFQLWRPAADEDELDEA